MTKIGASGLSLYPLETLYELADGACAEWDLGASFEEIALVLYDVSPADWDYETVGNFLGAVATDYCPEHKGLIP